MKHNDCPYASEKLQQLVDSINANYPLPQQPVTQVLDQLQQLAEATCTEFSENFASLHGQEMAAYAEWAHEKLFQMNVYGYQMLMASHSENPLLKRVGIKPRPDTAEYQIGKVISEGMSREERKERFEFCQNLGDKYLDIVTEVENYFQEQHLQARKVELLLQDKEKYISVKLERKHQNYYFGLLEKLLDSGDIDENLGVSEKFPYLLKNFYENMKVEITNNFNEFSATVTQPYLAQMKELFTAQLLQSRLVAPQCITLKPFRESCIEQLEVLCQQVEQYQELQAQRPYTEDLDDSLTPCKSFMRFLLFRNSGMLTALMEKEGTEMEDKIKITALSLKMSQSKFLKYLALNQQPVSSWKKKQQRQLALVEEYCDRITAIKEYVYSLEKA